MALTEKQWAEMSYARLKADLDRLDADHTINVAVYTARRKLMVDMFTNISDRLDEIDAEEKRNE